jgi:hypothetical protein
MRVQQTAKSTINADRAKALLEAVRRRIMRGEGDNNEMRTAVFDAFAKYFTELGQPTLEYEPLLGFGSRDPDAYVEMVRRGTSDLQAAANDSRNLAGSIVATFNYTTTRIRMLEGRIQQATSKSQDLQHLTERFVEDTIVAGDDFVDNSRIDRSARLEVPVVEVPLNQGNAVLRREQGKNVLQGGNVKITVLSTFRIYEGKFYALAQEARPEGGRFHFSGTDRSRENDLVAKGAPPDLLRRFNSWRIDPANPVVTTPVGERKRADITAQQALGWSQAAENNAWGPFTESEWDMLANNYHTSNMLGLDQSYASPTDRLVQYDRGASPEEKQQIRQRMIDGSPDTFWECEYVVNAGESLVPLAQEPDAPQTGDNGKPTLQDVLTYGTTPGTSRPDPDSGTSQAETGAGITMEELLDKIAGPAVDKLDLDVAIIFELPDVALINWVNVMPHNFSDAAWLEVLDVSTSVDGRTFEKVEGLAEGKFERILTEAVNAELTEEESKVTMAPSKFRYVGQGVFTFPTREARYIKIQLLQRTPVPAPYDVLQVEMTQTVTTTTEKRESFGLFNAETWGL